MILQMDRDLRREAARTVVSVLAAILIIFGADPPDYARAGDVLEAAPVGHPMTLDGDTADWEGTAAAAFNGVDGRKHSVSEVLTLKTMH